MVSLKATSNDELPLPVTVVGKLRPGSRHDGEKAVGPSGILHGHNVTPSVRRAATDSRVLPHCSLESAQLLAASSRSRVSHDNWLTFGWTFFPLSTLALCR